MNTITLDLRPGSLNSPNGSLFEVSISQWKAINTYLGNVAAIDIPANSESAMPAFVTLKASAVQWKATTLPNLINLSQGIYNYGANTVAAQFPRLQQLLETMKSEIPPNSAADFHHIMSTILVAAQQNTALAITIAKEFETIDTSVQVSKKQIQDYLASLSPSAPPPGFSGARSSTRAHSYFEFQMYNLWQLSCAPPQSEIERVRGDWSSISDDLKSFQSTVNEEIASSSPFLAKLNLDVAISEWQGLASEARQFSENLSSL